jgi:hypothetical protein
LNAQETREAINSLTAINNEALVIDLDTVDDAALIDTLHAYRGSGMICLASFDSLVGYGLSYWIQDKNAKKGFWA